MPGASCFGPAYEFSFSFNKDLQCRKLRHMRGLGVAPYAIGKILGHGNVQTTQRCSHLQVEQQRTALPRLEKLIDFG